MFAFLGMLACGAISLSLARNAGHYEPYGLALLTIGFCLTIVAVLWIPSALDRVYAFASVLLSILILGVEIFSAGYWSLGGWMHIATAGIGVLYFLNLSPRYRPWLWPSAFVLLAASAATSLYKAQPPIIDVWHFQQNAAQHLLNGDNPYSQRYPNIYGDDENYGAKLLIDGEIRSFPYPPLSLAFLLPGRLLGDVRWSFLFAMLVSVAVLIPTARRLGLPKGSYAELIAIAFLANPLHLFVLWQAWTEPLLALSVGCFLWTCATHSRWVWVAAACIVSAKQYGFLILVPFWLAGHLRTLHVLLAVAASFLMALPFLVWDFEEVVWGNVWFHVHNTFRTDALSISAHVYHVAGWVIPSWAGLVSALLTAVVCRFANPSLAHATMSAAAVLTAFFLFGKNAFCNYYWLVLYLIVAACILRFAESSKDDAGNADEGRT